jgi:hypothetical protein
VRIVAVLAVTVLVFSGILVGMRVVGSSGGEATRVKVPATAGGKGPGAVEEGEPAMAEILFKKPVGVKEVLRIVGEDNRGNLTTLEGSFRAGGEEIGDFFSVPSGLETAEEIERAWVKARKGSLADKSAVSEGPVVEEPGLPEGVSGEIDAEIRTQSKEMKDAMKDPGTREILVTKASLEGSSLELKRLPAVQSDAIKTISVTTRSDILEMMERAREDAQRRGEPPPKFD